MILYIPPQTITTAQISDASPFARLFIQATPVEEFGFLTVSDSEPSSSPKGTTETQTPVTSLTFVDGICTAAS